MECRYHACKKKKLLKLMVMNTDRLPCRLGRHPVKQGPRSHLGCHGWIEKLTTGPKIKVVRKVLKIGTWNVQTLWRAGKLDLLREEMKPCECDNLGIAEMPWTKTGEIGGGEVIWLGGDKDHERRVGFLLSKKQEIVFLGINLPVLELLLQDLVANHLIYQSFKFMLQQLIVQVHIEDFCSLVESTLKDLPNKDMCILLGNLNAYLL